MLAVVCATGWSSTVQAAERVSLRWNAPESCPDDAQLIGAVEGFLGQRLAQAREQELTANINVQGGEEGYSAKLTFVGPQGSNERFLEHPDCSKLMAAAALVVALAIDPERVRARQAATESGGEPARPEPAFPIAAEPKPEPICPAPVVKVVERTVPPPQPTTRGALGVSAFVGTGALPRRRPNRLLQFSRRARAGARTGSIY